MTKSMSVFPTDDRLFKMLYLAVLDITKKWTGRRQGWGQIYPQLALYYGDRNPINYRAGTAVFVTGFTLHFNSNFY